jgi:hypothetical protein
VSRSTMPNSNPADEPDQTYRDAVIAAMGHRLAAAGPRTRQRLLDRQIAPEDTPRDATKEVSTVDWWPSLMSRADDDGWEVPAPDHQLFGFIPPWRDCVTAARRFALLGTAASCGFAVVLLGLSHHVGAPRHRTANGAARAAEEASLDVTSQPVILASATAPDPSGTAGAVPPATQAAPPVVAPVTPAFEATPGGTIAGTIAGTTAKTTAETTPGMTTPSETGGDGRGAAVSASTVPPPDMSAPPSAPAVSNVAVVAEAVVAPPVGAGPVAPRPVIPQAVGNQAVPPPPDSTRATVAPAAPPPASPRTPLHIAAAPSPDHGPDASVSTPPKPVHVNAAAGARPAGRGEIQPENVPRPTTQHPASPWAHPHPWRPEHAAPVLLAHAAPKPHERPAEHVDFDVPRWLAAHNPPRPRVIVMSEPAHFLTQPPERMVAQAPGPAQAPAAPAQPQPAPQRAPVVVASSAYGTAPFGWPAYRPNYGGYYGPPQGSYYPPPSGGYYGGYYGGGAPY